MVLRRRGFTLVELLIVIAIITILAALLMPALQKVMISARTMACTNGLKQLGTAFQAYKSENREYPQRGASGDDATGKNRGFTMLWIAPYMGATGRPDPMGDHNDAAWIDECNEFFRLNKAYHCSARPGEDTGYLGYVVNAKHFGEWQSSQTWGESGPDYTLPESLSTTILFTDVRRDFYAEGDDYNDYNIHKSYDLPWYNGINDSRCRMLTVEEMHHGEVAPLLFWDGHAKTKNLLDVDGWPDSLIHGSPDDD